MCGIFGVYSLLNEYIEGSVVIRALAAMRERGTRHGAGVALYAPSPHTRVKFFTHTPPPDAAEVYKLPSGMYDVTKYGDGDIDGVVYLRSKWLDVYKVIGWPEDIDNIYKISYHTKYHI